MAIEFRVTVFGEPRAPWRSSRDQALRDAINLDLASWDGSRREWFLAVPVSIERRGSPDPHPVRVKPVPNSRWSPDEIARLGRLLEAGEHPHIIALRLGRSRAACASKAAQLGLTPRGRG